MDNIPQHLIDYQANIDKFKDPLITLDGSKRALITLQKLKTLWFNTGSLCNIECENCYILSSPTNDTYQYFKFDYFKSYIDELLNNIEIFQTSEIAFTGGEPFMNPEIIKMVEYALEKGFQVLILTNAMKPMMRKSMKEALIKINAEYPKKVTLRVSLDHYTEEAHDIQRGDGTFKISIIGLLWLHENRFKINIAGRKLWDEDAAKNKAGYGKLIDELQLDVDINNPQELVLFPEMDLGVEVPEITTSCFSILGVNPDDIMCATSRMIVHEKGEKHPTILPCTLLVYEKSFNMGVSLKEMLTYKGGNIDDGKVYLNHPHCAKFCVLGGGSCSVS